MQAEDRPIHFSTEMIHPPAGFEKPALQRLYFELSQTPFAYDSSDFSPPTPPRFYSKGPGKAQSILLFLPDRFVVIEEWVTISLTQFLDKLEAVSAKVMDELSFPPVTVQTAVIRTTFALSHFDDARAFLMDHACQQEGRVGPHMGRPVGVAGLRFVLPETPDHPGDLNVTIESYRHGQDEVFVEVKGIYQNQRIDAHSLDTARANVNHVRTFISNHVYPYLEQFDAVF